MRCSLEIGNGKYVLRPFKSGDEKGILNLWKIAFKSEMSIDTFKWKYLENPYTRSMMLCVTEKSEIVTFCENIEVPSSLVPNKERTYALKITGDSMIDEHICEGDIVIVEKTATASTGDIVIALVNASETTVKRFKQEGDFAVLIPANSNMKPIKVPMENVQIQGVVVGVVRKY